MGENNFVETHLYVLETDEGKSHLANKNEEPELVPPAKLVSNLKSIGSLIMGMNFGGNGNEKIESVVNNDTNRVFHSFIPLPDKFIEKKTLKKFQVKNSPSVRYSRRLY